jgi:hypothetical protein
MATIVWGRAGDIQQVQVGAADIVATLSGMNAAWGWIGGLSGFRHILFNISNPLGKEGFSNIKANLKLLPAVCYIITAAGIVPFRDEKYI